MIGGLITAGTGTRVIVRALGPTLTSFGVPGALQDPVLTINDANQHPIASNDIGKPVRRFPPSGRADSLRHTQLSPLLLSAAPPATPPP